MANDLLSVFQSTAPRQPKREIDADYVWRIWSSVLRLSNISMPQPSVVGAPPKGQVSIAVELFALLYDFHCLGRYKSLRMFYTDRDPQRFHKERELWQLLTAHRHNSADTFQIILTGEPGTKFPTHPKLGALYAGDHIWLINDAFLIHRRSPKSNEAHGGEKEEGYYLLAMSECGEPE